MTTQRPAAHETRSPEDLERDADPIETFSAEQILFFVRDEAADRDPRYAHLYRSMSAGRVKDGIEVAQQLLRAHLALYRCHGRGGRKEHRAAIERILESTNDASLVLALAWLTAAFALLPRSRPR